ncbi:MAG: hypothetical protein PHN92_08595 [Geobacter sp.]|nr:hypothetical protein [Geobacter sp.]
MGMKGILRMLACGTILCTAASAWSFEFHGRSSTQLQWFNNYFDNNKQVELGQYLSASLTKLDDAGKLSFEGYGRLTQDIRNGEGLQGRVYYLYANYKDLFNKVDIRLGRQFVNYSAGSSLIDGAKIDVKDIGPIALSVMGGRNITYNLYNESTHEGDYAVGVAAYLYNIKNTDLELSWYHKLIKDDVAQDILGASFKQYLFDKVKLYGNTRYDLASEVFGEVLAGASYFPLDNLIFTAEWYQSYPTFDATSIYSVFAVNRYQEALVKADYRINKMFSVNAGYTRQDYGEGDSDVVELGVGIRPMDTLRMNLNYDYVSGYDGKRNGCNADIEYEAVKDLKLGAGYQYNVAKYDATTGEVIGRSYWGGAKYKINKTMSFNARLENNVNTYFKEDWRGRVAFNIDF